MEKNTFIKIANKFISLLAASAILTTQISASIPAQAIINATASKVSETKAIDISSENKYEAHDATSTSVAISSTTTSTTVNNIQITDSLNSNSTKLKANPYLSMDKKVVPASAAGTSVILKIYLNDDFMGDNFYFRDMYINIDMDKRLIRKSIDAGDFDTAEKLYVKSSGTLVNSTYRNSFEIWCGADTVKGNYGKNGVFATIEVMIPTYAKPGDIYYVNIFETKNCKSRINTIDTNWCIGESGKSVVTVDTSDDKYLKDTQYDGYILIDPDSKANATITSSPYDIIINDSVTYAIYEDHAEVAYCDFEAEKAVIQSEIKGKPVTLISDYAFAKTNIKSVVIPNTITSIGEHAFMDSCVESLSIPSSVESIGVSAFEGCRELSDLKLQTGIKIIPEKMCYNCSALKEIVIPSSVETIGNDAFRSSDLSSVTISDSVTSLGENVFDSCTSLTELKLPDSITHIGQYAFKSSNIKKINLPASIKSCREAFALSRIERIDCSNEIKTIPEYAFGDASNLKYIKFPSEITTIPFGAFFNCTSLETIEIPDSVLSIDSYAFDGAKNLKSIKLNDGLEIINSKAFLNCQRLESLTLPKSLKTIGVEAFCNCEKLKEITIPDSVTSIYDNTFAGTKFTSIQIPESVTYISTSAFSYSHIDTIYGIKGSTAEAFATSKRLKFIDIEANTESSQSTTTTTLTTTTKPISTTTSTTSKTTSTFSMRPVTSENKTTSATTTFLINNTTVIKTASITTTTSKVHIPPEPHFVDIQGEMKVKEMSLEEIKGAGIDLKEPSNYHVYEYETKMTFESQKITINHIIARMKNDMLSSSNTSSSSGNVVRTPTVKINDQEKQVLDYFEDDDKEMYMIIEGECKWLKEFYDVELIVVNKDKKEKLTDCIATINVPDGLTLVNCEKTKEISGLEPRQGVNIHWYIRGDEVGDYDLTASFTGKHKGVDLTYFFKSKNTLHVYAADALKMVISLPKYSLYNQAYPIKISIQNVSDKSIYINHMLKSFSQWGTKYSIKDIFVLKLYDELEPIQKIDYKYISSITHGQNTANPSEMVITLDPGNEIVIDIAVNDLWQSDSEAITSGLSDIFDIIENFVDPLSHLNYSEYYNNELPLYEPKGIKIVRNYSDPIILFAEMGKIICDCMNFVHILNDVDVFTLPGSTTSIPYEVEIIDNLEDIPDVNLMNIYKGPNTITTPDNYTRILYNTWHDYSNEDSVYYAVNKLGSVINTWINKPTAGNVEFYIQTIENDFKRAPNLRYYSPNLNTNDYFDIEVVEGEYSINDKGNLVFSSDAIVNITPNKAGIKANLVAKNEDNSKETIIPIIVVEEHECIGKKVILTSPTEDKGAIMASFCENCNDILECKTLPIKATAMLSNGECYDDIRGAIADYKNYDEELSLYIFGNLNIVEDVTIPDDLTLIIVPETKIKNNNGCKFIAKGEVRDYSGYNYDFSGNGPITSNVSTTTAMTTITTTTVIPSSSNTTVSQSTTIHQSVSTTSNTNTTISPKTTVTYTTSTTTTTTPSIPEQHKNILGDVNNDGQINASDASSVLSYYAMISTNKDGGYTEEQKLAADVNNDSQINAVDASCILSYYAYVSTTKEDIMSISDFLKK